MFIGNIYIWIFIEYLLTAYSKFLQLSLHQNIHKDRLTQNHSYFMSIPEQLEKSQVHNFYAYFLPKIGFSPCYVLRVQQMVVVMQGGAG